MVFTFQSPFLAGLSGYVAELIPAMLAAFLASDREFTRKRETLTGRVK
jgi:hypothetical protein